MTQKEVHRAEVFAKISQHHVTKTQAAIELGLSIRQILRLYKLYKHYGRAALRSRKRGKLSNHQLPKAIKDQVADLVARSAYAGFRPTFMCEKLAELHGLALSRETVRQLMMLNGVWSARSRKRPVVHQQRRRRARYGELIQIDGSPHDWFEDRGERCALLVYIDDATGRTFGKFVEVESSEAYMDITREYIKKFGIPRCFYSDKHGIFRVNRKECLKEEVLTQFGRALKELDIELICANSPQAKGRVERVNQTLQDRLVKDLRVVGVCTIEDANKYLEESGYWKKFNARFSVPPISGENAHREIPQGCALDEILCFKSVRTVTKNLEFQYNNVIYQISPEDQMRSLCGAHVTVVKKLDGTMCVIYKDRKIRIKEYRKQCYVGPEVDSKEIDKFLKVRLPRRVPDTHPWKRRHRYIA